MGYTLRTERYRYTEWHNNTYKSFDPYDTSRIAGRELYDYHTDTFETVNVIEHPEYADIAGKLSREMSSFLRSQEDIFPGHRNGKSLAEQQAVTENQ
jgi:hypothetical protein